MSRATTRNLSITPIEGLPDGNVLVTEIYYDKGGISMLSGNAEGRGYWVAVRPEVHGVGRGRTFTLFEGGKIFVEPAKAFSAKKLAALVPNPEKVAALQAKVLADKFAKVSGETGVLR